jgi:hypothetical protein
VRVVRRAPRPTSAALGVRARSSPDVPLRPRLTASLGYVPTEAARAPRRATRRRTARAVPTGHVPLRTGGPSASSRPRALCYGRDSRRRHLQVGPALFKCRHFPLCAPTEPPPSIAAAAGELAAPLAPAAGRPSHSLP